MVWRMVQGVVDMLGCHGVVIVMLIPVTILVPVSSKNIHNRNEGEDARGDGRDATENLQGDERLSVLF